MAVRTKQSAEESKPEAALEKMSSRDQMLAILENLNPLTKEEAEMINKAVMEAREKSIGENIPA